MLCNIIIIFYYSSCIIIIGRIFQLNKLVFKQNFLLWLFLIYPRLLGLQLDFLLRTFNNTLQNCRHVRFIIQISHIILVLIRFFASTANSIIILLLLLIIIIIIIFIIRTLLFIFIILLFLLILYYYFLTFT